MEPLRKSSTDLIKSWRYSATMQMRIPLRILEQHGRVIYAAQPPEEPVLHHGVWLPVLKTWGELGTSMPELEAGRMMASEVGPIPADGGDYLRFLMAVRGAVEAVGPVPERLADLRAELAKPAWSEFVAKLNGREAIYALFFPAFIEAIPGLQAETVAALWGAELTTPRAISGASDAKLRAIKGIGPAKLKAIRDACAAAPDQDAERLDKVER